MLKVCHFVAQVGLGRGDSFVELVNALVGQAAVSMVVPADARFLGMLDPRVEVHTYSASGQRWNPLLYWQLVRLFRRISPDVVHTHFAKAAEVFVRLNRVLHLRYVGTKHNPRRGAIFDRLDYVVAVSGGVRDSIRHDRVRVIYNGIRPEPVDASPPPGRFRIISVGRLTPIKGFDHLLRQLARLDFDFHMTFLGDGQQRAGLEALSRQLGLADRVEFAGFCSDVPQRLAASHLQVMSSHSEGFSLAMIEAVFYAPVFISTPVAGCREILPAGLVAEQDRLADLISRVHADYPRYLELFRGVKDAYSERLNITSGAREHLLLYREITAAPA